MNKQIDKLTRETLENKKMVFTVSTGRSGTGYLELVMSFIPDLVSLHEPEPFFHDHMRQVQTDPARAYEFLCDVKLPAIAEYKNSIYFESSHLFCKGFLEPCLELGIVPDLIYLHRSFRKTSLSFLKMNVIPGRTDKGIRFCLKPDDPGVLPLKNWEKMTDYQLSYWYCMEIERRAEQYRQLYKKNGWRFVSISLEELVTFKGYLKLLKGLEIKNYNLYSWLKYFRDRNTKANESLETKKDFIEIPTNLDEQEEEVRACCIN